jgi:hypothetical protein
MIGEKNHKWEIIMIIRVGGCAPRKIKLANTAKNRKALMITGPAIWSRECRQKEKEDGSTLYSTASRHRESAQL